MTGPYAEAAQLCWQAGWPNPIPVRAKDGPVKGVTGRDGRNVSYPDLMAWTQGPEGALNIALRLAGVIGLDLDDGGQELIEKAEAELGPLPPSWSSTSRGPSQPRRIKFFRIDFATEQRLSRAQSRLNKRFGGAKTGSRDRDAVDILHRGHRYALCWPSIHPDSGAVYLWYGPDGAICGVPELTSLPWLPQAWADFLADPIEPAAVEVSSTAPALLTPGQLGVRYFTAAEVRQLLDRVLADFAKMTQPNSGRSDFLHRSVATYFGHFVPEFISAEQATDEMLAVAHENGYVRTRGLSDAKRQINRGLTERTGLADDWVAQLMPTETVAASNGGAPTIVGPSRYRASELDVRPPAEVIAQESTPEFDRLAASWELVDLTTYLDGSYRPPEPSIGYREDGECLIYPGKEHALYGETEAMKTWITLSIGLDCLRRGESVLIIDFEDDAATFVTRLRQLGATDDMLANRKLFGYISPEVLPSREIIEQLADHGWHLVLLDGVTEAYALGAWEIKDNGAAAMFRRLFVKPFTRAGSAVISTDHVTKAFGDQGRYALGAQHKLAGLTGAAFKAVNKTPGGLGQRGVTRIYVTKDRPGQLRQHGLPGDDGMTWIGDFVLEARSEAERGNSRPGAWIYPPKPTDATRDAGDIAAAAKAQLRNQVVAYVRSFGESGVGKVEIRGGVTGSNTEVDAALAEAVRDGLLIQNVNGRAKPYVVTSIGRDQTAHLDDAGLPLGLAAEWVASGVIASPEETAGGEFND